MLARAIHDPRKGDGLLGFGAGELRERHHVLHLQVVADALAVFECAMFHPDFARQFGDLAVLVNLVLGNREDKSVNVMSHVAWLV
jgi:hypothetical protein